MIASMISAREAALWVWEAAAKEGVPYRWGGDNPLTGFDCSGLVNEGLKAAGRIGRDEDATAYDLSHRYKVVPEAALKPGCLLFWNRGEPPRVGHVEIVWRLLEDGTILTIGASGGGSKTTTPEAAAQTDAYVKIRPAAPGWIIAVDPFLV